MSIAESTLLRFDALKGGERGNWEEHWQQIAQVIAPRKSDMTGMVTPGERKNLQVYDSTGIQANELLAAGLHGLATNPATRWFGVRVLDDELMKIEAVKEYLSDTEARMFREMHAPGASISTHIHECYLDGGAFGTAVLFIGDNDGRPQFQARHLREVYLDEDADGDVDTVYRCFEMSARQIKQKWPESIPRVVAEAISSGKESIKFEIIHGVFPRDEVTSGSKLRKDMPVASVYVMRDGKELLDDGGFDEFPYAVFMWSKTPGEKYGRGPGMAALPDVKMLQQMMKTHLRAAQKVVDPPLKVNDDGVIAPIRTMPGGLNFLRPGADIAPLQTGARIDISFEMMEDVRSRVGRAFFSGVVRPFNERSNETATEVMQRVQQQMRLLGPVLGRLEKFLGQIVARVNGIMARAGKLGVAPDELADQPFTVEFVSPIATAQRSGEVENVVNWLTLNTQFAQADPAIMDKIDFAKLPEWTADRLRVDPELTLDDKEAEEKAQGRQMQQAAALAGPAKDGAQAMKTAAEAQQIVQAA